MTELPEWPKKPKVSALGSQFTLKEVISVAGYEHARATAAIARLRVAVDHIYHAPRCAMMQPVGKMACDCGYHEALDAIGPLPAGEGEA